MNKYGFDRHPYLKSSNVDSQSPSPKVEPVLLAGSSDRYFYERGYEAGKRAGARAALAAPAPQALPATLTDEMRAVLANEKCVYRSADELYAALLATAPQTKEPKA